MTNNYIEYAVYKCPENPAEQGVYIGKTPIYEQAENVVKRAKLSGRNYFIKGIKPDGTEVIFL